jgi:hypothetical protein
MTTVWAMLGDAFYHSLIFDGWVRVDNYVDRHGLVAMVRARRLSDSPAPHTDPEDLSALHTARIANWVGGPSGLQ